MISARIVSGILATTLEMSANDRLDKPLVPSLDAFHPLDLKRGGFEPILSTAGPCFRERIVLRGDLGVFATHQVDGERPELARLTRRETGSGLGIGVAARDERKCEQGEGKARDHAV